MKICGGTTAVVSIVPEDTKWRGAIIAAVFAMQGLGQFVAALVSLIVTKAYKENLITATSVGTCDDACMKSIDMMWRIVIGFGGIPGWVALFYRLTIPEIP
jgi:PHS family inorganic phosphate transporter-like MFS transporter